MPSAPITFAEVSDAAQRLRGVVHQTPVVTCATLDAMAGRSLFFKCENLQKVGAFKYRGASNAVMKLDEAAAKAGVVTHSSGNHAQALALAAKTRGIPAHIVMPTSAPAVKRAAVEGYGARVVPCEPTLEARETTAAQVVAETGATFIHPYDHLDVIAGQGTAALELFEEVGPLDAVVAPVGGGGLLSGTALTAGAQDRPVPVFAAEPEGADDAARSKAAGERLGHQPGMPQTLADGLLTTVGELTWPIIRDRVVSIETVDDAQIVRAMQLFWERAKGVIEPSAAVPLAALLFHPAWQARPQLRRVGVILSGGNVDLRRLPFAGS